jgi:uncharacterized protein (DUF433 family)
MEMVAEEMSVAEILKADPDLDKQDVRGALACAATKGCCRFLNVRGDPVYQQKHT